jgi:hypothetical protein
VTTVLEPGVGFILGYDATNDIVTLSSPQGVWTQGTYVITLTNSGASAIKDQAGNNLQPNEATLVTQFTVQIADTAGSTWQNPLNKYDVDASGFVSGLDALLIINRLIEAGGSFALPVVPIVPPYLDVSGDGALCSPLDALQVINFLSTPAPLTAAPTTAAPEDAEPMAMSSEARSSETAPAATAAPAADVADTSAIGFSLTVGASPSASSAPATSAIDVTSTSTEPAGAPSTLSTVNQSVADDLWADDDWDAADDDLDGIVSDLYGDADEDELVTI